MQGTMSLSNAQLQRIAALANCQFYGSDDVILRPARVVTVVVHPPETLHGPVRVQLHREHAESVEVHVKRDGFAFWPEQVTV